MSQTTTTRGRLGIPDPDLGFDTLDGGTALHTQLSANFTAFADHLTDRYYSYGNVTNNTTKTIVHNFGLALSKLKVIIFEGGAQISAATQASHWTIAQSDTNTITVQNTSGGTINSVLVYVFSYVGGITSTDFDAAVSITTTGTIIAAAVNVTGNDIILNNSASESVASWKLTIHRPTSGMTADATITMPNATATVATLALAETLSGKTFTTVASITLVASGAIDWAAGSVSVGASIGANTMTVGGSTSTVRIAGACSSLTLTTDSNDLVLNNAAAGSGADWKGTVRRPSSGMTGAAIWTMPNATCNIIGDSIAATITVKIIDGGTASTTSRWYVPKDTKTNLDSLTKTSGMMVWATDLKQLFVADGTNYNPIGGSGGGGGSASWNPPSGVGAILSEDNSEKVYLFPSGSAAELDIYVRVPASYVAGNQINMDIGLYSASNSNTILLSSTTYLFQKNSTALTSTTNSYASTNAALTNTVANMYRTTILDLTSSTGTINSVAVASGDLLRVKLVRGSDSDTADISFVPSATQVRFQ